MSNMSEKLHYKGVRLSDLKLREMPMADLSKFRRDIEEYHSRDYESFKEVVRMSDLAAREYERRSRPSQREGSADSLSERIRVDKYFRPVMPPATSSGSLEACKRNMVGLHPEQIRYVLDKSLGIKFPAGYYPPIIEVLNAMDSSQISRIHQYFRTMDLAERNRLKSVLNGQPYGTTEDSGKCQEIWEEV